MKLYSLLKDFVIKNITNSVCFCGTSAFGHCHLWRKLFQKKVNGIQVKSMRINLFVVVIQFLCLYVNVCLFQITFLYWRLHLQRGFTRVWKHTYNHQCDLSPDNIVQTWSQVRRKHCCSKKLDMYFVTSKRFCWALYRLVSGCPSWKANILLCCYNRKLSSLTSIIIVSLTSSTAAILSIIFVGEQKKSYW